MKMMPNKLQKAHRLAPFAGAEGGSRLRKPHEIPRQRGVVRQWLLLRARTGDLLRSGEQAGPALPPLGYFGPLRRGGRVVGER